VAGRDGFRRWCAIAGIVGQVAFTAGWLLAQSLEDRGYDPARHDISDLGALTARHPWIMLTGQAIGGLGTVAFALGALRPAMRGSRAGVTGAWLLAASALGLDNLSDVLFRLDCRAADGCTDAQQTASWHGTVHGLAGVTVLLLAVVPFVLAAAFRRVPGWSRLVGVSLAAGLAEILLIGGYLAMSGHAGSGYVQRGAAAVAAAWVVALAATAAARGPVPAPAHTQTPAA